MKRAKPVLLFVFLAFASSQIRAEDDYEKYKAAYQARSTKGTYEIVIEYEKRLEANQQEMENLKLDIKERDKKIGELNARIMDETRENKRLEKLCKEAGIETETESKKKKNTSESDTDKKQSVHEMIKEKINNALGKPGRADIKNALWDIAFGKIPKTGDSELQILWAVNDASGKELCKMLRAIKDTKLQFRRIHFFGTAKKQDKFGKSYEKIVFNKYILYEDLQKINWDNIEKVDFLGIAQDSQEYPAWLDRYVTVDR